MQEAYEILISNGLSGVILFISMRLNFYQMKKNEEIIKTFNQTIKEIVKEQSEKNEEIVKMFNETVNKFLKNEVVQTELMRDVKKMTVKLMDTKK